VYTLIGFMLNLFVCQVQGFMSELLARAREEKVSGGEQS